MTMKWRRPRTSGDASRVTLHRFRRMSNGMKDLKAWQAAVQLAGEVVRTMRQAARRETKGFTDATMEAATAIPAALADGYALHDAAEHRAAASLARRRLAVLDTRLAIAKEAGLISASTHAALGLKSSLVGRLLAGYLGYLDRQVGMKPAVADAVSALEAEAGA